MNFGNIYVIIAESSRPIEITFDATLHTGHKAELVTTHPVELAFLTISRTIFGAEIGRRETVEAKEIELFGVEIGAVEEELSFWN